MKLPVYKAGFSGRETGFVWGVPLDLAYQEGPAGHVPLNEREMHCYLESPRNRSRYGVPVADGLSKSSTLTPIRHRTFPPFPSQFEPCLFHDVAAGSLHREKAAAAIESAQ